MIGVFETDAGIINLRILVNAVSQEKERELERHRPVRIEARKVNHPR